MSQKRWKPSYTITVIFIINVILSDFLYLCKDRIQYYRLFKNLYNKDAADETNNVI